jgi:formate dehydrogenase subunit gamma
MTRYIERHNKVKRMEHWSHVISTIVLIITGLFVFVPALGQAIGAGALEIIRMGHRVFAVTFISVPIVTTLIHPQNIKHQLGNLFAPWDEDDKKFMKLFVPYLFAPKKIHMPKQHAVKSGQRLADSGLVIFAVVMAISGAVLWGGKFFAPSVITWALLVHDVAFVMISILIMAHAYLGAGIFQPYRGIARVMFGDGLVSEADARYHWGYWAEEELESGKNVVEV